MSRSYTSSPPQALPWRTAGQLYLLFASFRRFHKDYVNLGYVVRLGKVKIHEVSVGL
jgi:hypothetical protein